MTNHEIKLLLVMLKLHGAVLEGAEAINNTRIELEKFYRTQSGEILTDPRCRVLLRSYQSYLQSVREFADCTNDSIIAMSNEMNTSLLTKSYTKNMV